MQGIGKVFPTGTIRSHYARHSATIGIVFGNSSLLQLIPGRIDVEVAIADCSDFISKVWSLFALPIHQPTQPQWNTSSSCMTPKGWSPLKIRIMSTFVCLHRWSSFLRALPHNFSMHQSQSQPTYERFRVHWAIVDFLELSTKIPK